MTENIKKYIEDHIELLEKDPVEFFVVTYEQTLLDRADVAYMSSLLSDAGIEDVDLAREMALLKILDTQISDWALADGGVSAMPVYDFIQAFLDNCIGYDENYVLLFMKKHAQRWDKWANIVYHAFDGHGLTIIERK